MARQTLFVTLVGAALLTAACGRPPAGPEANTTPSDEREPLVYEGQLVEVVPPDSIPSIDRPRFIAPGDANWLAGREPVVSLEIVGQARAYPVQILTWHEIVNDEVAGRPVTVTYCPLCNSALAFDREVDGRVLEFGTSGKLYRSALVMYDRQTGSLWSHFEGLAIRGPLTGTRLELIPVQMLSFRRWQTENPEGLVLSRDTGERRSYGENPYEYYDRQEGPYGAFFSQSVNYRLPAMARVVGVSIGETDVAYAYRGLSDRGPASVVRDRVAGRSIVVFWRAGTASALDTVEIAEGRDVGATGVFVPQVGGRSLTFTVHAGQIVDRETGSTWSVTGRAVSGRLDGARLELLHHLDTFWFAWQAYKPDTLVYGVDA